jgi:hypothetical protein
MEKTGRIIRGILIAIVVVVIGYIGIQAVVIVRPFEPPSDSLYYGGTDEYGQDIFVALNPDSTLTLFKSNDDDTVEITYRISGEYGGHLFGSLYITGTYLWNIRAAKENTRPLKANLECIDVSASTNAQAGVEIGETFSDLIWYSDNVFYMGDTRLERTEDSGT